MRGGFPGSSGAREGEKVGGRGNSRGWRPRNLDDGSASTEAAGAARATDVGWEATGGGEEGAAGAGGGAWEEAAACGLETGACDSAGAAGDRITAVDDAVSRGPAGAGAGIEGLVPDHSLLG